MSQPNDQFFALPKRLQAALLPKQSTILIAEDDPVSARILEAALSKFGYKPVMARNGADAWDKFDREPVRLIVSDWMMPDLDGLDL